MATNILFVDDEFAPDTATEFGSYMSYYELALIEGGYSVTRANDVDAALKLVNEQRFDLAILDLMMPAGQAFKDQDTMQGTRTGMLLAEQLRRFFKKMPILILCNSHSAAERYSSTVEQGIVNKILFKPDVTPLDLVEEVRFITSRINANA
ncbi:MAG TPA: response regulator [Gemmataceae bacterium]|nr:response regulator [Gemmataceae bacterium]